MHEIQRSIGCKAAKKKEVVGQGCSAELDGRPGKSRETLEDIGRRLRK